MLSVSACSSSLSTLGASIPDPVQFHHRKLGQQAPGVVEQVRGR